MYYSIFFVSFHENSKWQQKAPFEVHLVTTTFSPMQPRESLSSSLDFCRLKRVGANRILLFSPVFCQQIERHLLTFAWLFSRNCLHRSRGTNWYSFDERASHNLWKFMCLDGELLRRCQFVSLNSLRILISSKLFFAHLITRLVYNRWPDLGMTEGIVVGW